MRKGFTLIEMIFVVVISAALSLGSFKAMQALFLRSAKAKAVTDLSLQSQVVLDQLGVMLYNRIPNSVIGSSSDGTTCNPIEELDGTEKVLEWLASDDEQLLLQYYDGFVDMNASSRPNLSANNITNDFNTTKRNLIFSGAFDDGSEDVAACNGAFGWHGNDSNLSFDITTSLNQITFSSDVPDEIYEKYYITNTAYAVTRAEDVQNIANCSDLNNVTIDNNTLILFYNFYPYLGETYCGNGGAGHATVLAQDVSGFRASYVNDTIRLSIDMNRSIRGSTAVHVSKQKAVF